CRRIWRPRAEISQAPWRLCLVLPQKLWQPRNVRRNPARLVLAEQLGRRAPPRFALVINVCDLLPVGVTHDETVGCDFGSPWRREAALRGHGATCAAECYDAHHDTKQHHQDDGIGITAACPRPRACG